MGVGVAGFALGGAAGGSDAALTALAGGGATSAGALAVASIVLLGSAVVAWLVAATGGTAIGALAFSTAAAGALGLGATGAGVSALGFDSTVSLSAVGDRYCRYTSPAAAAARPLNRRSTPPKLRRFGAPFFATSAASWILGAACLAAERGGLGVWSRADAVFALTTLGVRSRRAAGWVAGCASSPPWPAGWRLSVLGSFARAPGSAAASSLLRRWSLSFCCFLSSRERFLLTCATVAKMRPAVTRHCPARRAHPVLTGGRA